MIFNPRTLKTVLGYCLTLVEKTTGLSLKKNNLSSIFNYLQINPNIATSGQPRDNQFEAIKAAGFGKVINLAPPSGENSVADEASILFKMGIDYINIPVDFSAPTEQDFEQFIIHMQSHQTQKVWVHCAANMRVSAFIFRYRTAILGENRKTAEVDLLKIWRPNKIWRKFTDKPAND
jgi:protein tyrosine phosphatase (PTP) superfamily phosphohydrolase (DUF442 family)